MQYSKSETVSLSFNDLRSLMDELVRFCNDTGIDELTDLVQYAGFSLTSLEHDDMTGFWTMEFVREI